MTSKTNKTNAAKGTQANTEEPVQNPQTGAPNASDETSAASINAGAVTQKLELTGASGSDADGTATAHASTAGANTVESKEPEGNKTTKKDQPDTSVKVIEKRKIKVLHVVARREKFRRAGFLFGSERTRLVVDDLTAVQVKQLKEEPLLVVTEATEEV
ncbi:MAG: hypothetical protein JNL77_05465 [Nitrosomonas sp.]|nr:hypothetical protein [Nitrosomonas sp.]